MKGSKSNKGIQRRYKVNSLSVSQEIQKKYGFNSFLGEPMFDSPTLKCRRTAETPDARISEDKEKESFFSLNRPITK